MKPSDSTLLAKRVRCLVPILIALAVVVAFWPSLSAEFVNWDDDANFLNNVHFRGLGWPNIRWMLTTVHMSNYQPLSWLTSALGYELWGMHPTGYHATSVALHALNAVLVYFVAVRLLRQAARAADDMTVSIAAAVAALFFAVHPLRTEPVAWLSGQHDLQAATFYLLAILCYLRASSNEARRWRYVAGATALFAAGMLSKVNGITLPFILLLLDIYPLRRLPAALGQWGKPQHRTILLEKLPMLAVAIAAGLVSVLARHATAVLQPLSLGFRVQQAFYGLAFYLGKTMVPVRLVPFYPVPLDLRLPPTTVVASIALVLVLSILAVYLRRSWPGLLAAWTYYVVTLLPVLGLIPVGTQLVADRYTYLPGMGWAMLLGAGVMVGLGRLQKRRLVGVGVAAVVTLLVAASWRQSTLWHDSETLYRYTLSQSPGIPEVHNNLGSLLIGQRRIEEGLSEYRKALASKPDFTRAMNNLGLALIGQQRFAEAIEQYERALAIEPDYAFAHNNLGLALMYLDRAPEALPHFQKAVALVPDYVVAHNNLGGALLTLGRREEAIEHFKKALELRPDYSAAETMLRIAESQQPQ